MEILRRDDIRRGGFAGLREYRLVTDFRLFGEHSSNGAWDGIGGFVYLADATFLPEGETRLHSHKEIDVISVMVQGRILHEGSLEQGQLMEVHHVQVQRAGGEGFAHNEINPDKSETRMIQLWVLPERPGQPSGYKLYSPGEGQVTRVYGGAVDQDETFDSHTSIDIGILQAGKEIALNGKFVAYVTRGCGTINGQPVGEGDLIRGEELQFKVKEKAQIIIIRKADA